ncbi:MAG: putative glycoside hydrolase [Armatimonadetes bacterium]|nr:putative glycoside hydrolase [Armatimonadota bacterium]
MARSALWIIVATGLLLASTAPNYAELQERDILATFGMMEHASLGRLPDGWIFVEPPPSEDPISLDTTTRVQGRSSLKFSVNGAPPGSKWHLRCVVHVGRNGVKIGDRLVMRARVKTGNMRNARLRVGLGASRADGSTIVAEEHRIESSNTDWRLYEASIVVPENTSRVSAGIVLDILRTGQGDATFWVDDVTITNGEMLEVPVRAQRNIRTFTYFSIHPDPYENARRYDVVILSPLDWIHARPIKYYNPQVQLYVYCNSVSTVGTVPGWMDPLDYEYVTTQRRDWLLTDPQGNPIPEPGYPGNLMVDIGKPDLQQRWATRAAQIAQRCGFDGVFIDNITYNYLSSSGIACREYSTDEEFRQAFTRFLQTVVPMLRQQGLKVMMNFGYPWNEHPIYETWMQMADIILAEAWVRVKHDGSLFFLHPLLQLRHIDALNMPHPVLFAAQGRAAPTEEQERRYLLGCALLNANQRTAFHLAPIQYQHPPDYLPDYELAIGQPLEAYELIAGERRSGGVFRRRFSNGIVLVNMHASQAFTVSLDTDYVDAYGKVYRQGAVELSPRSALILMKPNSGLQITLTPVGGSSRRPGEETQFEVVARNTTSAPMYNFTVRVSIPDSMQFIVGSASDGGIYDSVTRTVTWFIPSLSASQSVSRTFRARVR